MKLLRRRVYLRECDFTRYILPKAFKIGYHRVEWDLLTIDEISKDMTIRILKDQVRKSVLRFPTGRGSFDTGNTEEGALALKYVNQLQIHKELYNPRWNEWYWRYHDGFVELRYHSQHDWRPLGVVTLERDYQCWLI